MTAVVDNQDNGLVLADGNYTVQQCLWSDPCLVGGDSEIIDDSLDEQVTMVAALVYQESGETFADGLNSINGLSDAGNGAGYWAYGASNSYDGRRWAKFNIALFWIVLLEEWNVSCDLVGVSKCCTEDQKENESLHCIRHNLQFFLYIC